MRHSPAVSSPTLADQLTGSRRQRGSGTAQNALHALQCQVLEAVAASQPLDRVAHLLCLHVEQLAPGVVCSVLTVDSEGRLHPLAGPSLPDAYSRALDGTQIGPDVGACGSAAYYGRPVEVRDIDVDPRWVPFKAMPLAAGLRTCWSSPIKGQDSRVVGTFAFYYRTRRAPSALERRIVEACVPLCALAIERAEVWSRLEQANQRFEVVLSNMSQGVCFFDGARNLIMANQRYSEIYNLPPNSIGPGTSLQEIVDLRITAGSGPAMAADQYLDWRVTLKGSDRPTDTVVELANGRVISIHRQPMPDSGSVATHEDITERRRAEARIIYMARHDALTGLANRLLFRERMEQALALSGRGQECAVICLDLDHFKPVNDTFGHAVGDRLLQSAAERLQTCVREVDTVTRLGGDEFAVLLVGVDRPESAGELAQRLVRTLSAPFDLDGHRVVVGASAGIAVTPHDGTSPDKLLRSADTALYRAKLDERGTYRFFEPDMDARLQARVALELELRQAVQNHEFELVYQPLFNLATNAICGFEALLRWHHPTRGPLFPNEFIPMAEETGVIVPLGAWVLRRACAEAASWPTSVKVAVNLSAAQFKNKALVKTVEEALVASGISATRLELEITESVLLSNTAKTLATLHALRDLGVSISMDDFGTGYSSLSYLRGFPFDKIKIDQSFVRDISEREDSIAIIRAVVGLGSSLGMATTAEGVETPQQLARLRREGCTEAQGYLFSPPVSAEDARLMVGSS
jgi:diguanylate cyclase (GGDEF)-like protein